MFHAKDPFVFGENRDRHLFEDKIARIRCIESVREVGEIDTGFHMVFLGDDMTVDPQVEADYITAKKLQGYDEATIVRHLNNLKAGRYPMSNLSSGSVYLGGPQEESVSDFMSNLDAVYSDWEFMNDFIMYSDNYGANNGSYEMWSWKNIRQFMRTVEEMYRRLGLGAYIPLIKYDLKTNIRNLSDVVDVQDASVFSIYSPSFSQYTASNPKTQPVAFTDEFPFLSAFTDDYARIRASIPAPACVGAVRVITSGDTQSGTGGGYIRQLGIGKLSDGVFIAPSTRPDDTSTWTSNVDIQRNPSIDTVPLSAHFVDQFELVYGRQKNDILTQDFLWKGHNASRRETGGDLAGKVGSTQLAGGTHLGTLLTCNSLLRNMGIALDTVEEIDPISYNYEVWRCNVNRIFGTLTSDGFASAYQTMLDNEIHDPAKQSEIEAMIQEFQTGEQKMFYGCVYRVPRYYESDTVNKLELYGTAQEAGKQLLDEIYQPKDDDDPESVAITFRGVQQRLNKRRDKELKTNHVVRVEEKGSQLLRTDDALFKAVINGGITWAANLATVKPTFKGMDLPKDFAYLATMRGAEWSYTDGKVENDVLTYYGVSSYLEIYDAELDSTRDLKEMEDQVNFNPVALGDRWNFPVLNEPTTDVERRRWIAYKFPKEIERCEFVVTNTLLTLPI